jgi:hypothetical protein
VNKPSIYKFTFPCRSLAVKAILGSLPPTIVGVIVGVKVGEGVDVDSGVDVGARVGVLDGSGVREGDIVCDGGAPTLVDDAIGAVVQAVVNRNAIMNIYNLIISKKPLYFRLG